MKEGFSIQEIFNLLPHRYPFLLVDRVTDWEENKYIKAYKNVTVNEPFFQGHFPGLPIMPGVMIVEALAQCGGMLVLKTNKQPADESVFLFTGMEDIKFRKPVVPGDRLDMHCTIIRARLSIWKMRVEAYVDDALVSEGILSAAILSRKELK